MIGPPPTSGTRDSFTDLVLLAGCQRVPEVRAITDTAQRRRVCATVRKDGAWIDGGEDDEAIVRRVATKEAGTIGVFGDSFLAGHRDAIAAAQIDSVAPTPEAIAAGTSPVGAAALPPRTETQTGPCRSRVEGVAATSSLSAWHAGPPEDRIPMGPSPHVA